jgi:hypothetical protein
MEWRPTAPRDGGAVAGPARQGVFQHGRLRAVLPVLIQRARHRGKWLVMLSPPPDETVDDATDV